DDMTVLARQVSDPPPPLASVAPGVPPRLAETIDRCLAKDPDARFPNGAALADALAAALDRRAAVAVRAFVTEGRQLSTSALRRLCDAGVAGAGGLVGALERHPGLAGVVGVPTLFGVAAATALLAAVVARARTEHRTDPKAERRLRFWSGPPGAWLFALAGLRLTPREGAAVLSPAVTPVPGVRDA